MKKILAFMITVLAINAIVIYLYRDVKTQVLQRVGMECQKAAESSAKLIFIGHKDALHWVLANYGKGQVIEYDPRFREVKKVLAEVKETYGFRFIYLMKLNPSSKEEYILDSETIGSSSYSPPGTVESLAFSDDLELISKNPKSPGHTDDLRSYGQWGSFIWGWAPILEQDSILAYAGVDADSEYVQKALFPVFVVLVKTLISMNGVFFLVFVFYTAYSLYRYRRAASKDFNLDEYIKNLSFEDPRGSNMSFYAYSVDSLRKYEARRKKEREEKEEGLN
jgi:hypothetical protein